MEKYKEQMRIMNGGADSDEDEDKEDTTMKVSEEYEEWKGFSEGEDEEDKPKGILKKREVYGDDGTEVVIEEMSNDIEEIAKLNYVNLEKSKKVLEESIDRAKKYAVIAGAEKAKPKKKKFRYLSKNERRENNRKAVSNKRRK
jgi:ribosomal RNA-processing protein 17